MNKMIKVMVMVSLLFSPLPILSESSALDGEVLHPIKEYSDVDEKYNKNIVKDQNGSILEITFPDNIQNIFELHEEQYGTYFSLNDAKLDRNNKYTYNIIEDEERVYEKKIIYALQNDIIILSFSNSNLKLKETVITDENTKENYYNAFHTYNRLSQENFNKIQDDSKLFNDFKHYLEVMDNGVVQEKGDNDSNRNAHAAIVRNIYPHGVISQFYHDNGSALLSIGLPFIEEVKVYELTFDNGDKEIVLSEFRDFFHGDFNEDLMVLVGLSSQKSVNDKGQVQVRGLDFDGNQYFDNSFEYHQDLFYPVPIAGGGILEAVSTFSGNLPLGVDEYTVEYPDGSIENKKTSDGTFNVEYEAPETSYVKETDRVKIKIKHPIYDVVTTTIFGADGGYIYNMSDIVEAKDRIKQESKYFSNEKGSLNEKYNRKSYIDENFYSMNLTFHEDVDTVYSLTHYGEYLEFDSFSVNKVALENNVFSSTDYIHDNQQSEKKELIYILGMDMYSLVYDSRDLSLTKETKLSQNQQKAMESIINYVANNNYDSFNKVDKNQEIAHEFFDFLEVTDENYIEFNYELLANVQTYQSSENGFSIRSNWNIDDKLLLSLVIPFNSDVRIYKIIFDNGEVFYAPNQFAQDFNLETDIKFVSSINVYSNKPIVKQGNVKVIGMDYSGKTVYNQSFKHPEKIFQPHPMAGGGIGEEESVFTGFMPEGVDEYIVEYPNGVKEKIKMTDRNFEVIYRPGNGVLVQEEDSISILIKYPSNGVWIRTTFTPDGYYLLNKDAITMLLKDVEKLDLNLYTQESVKNLMQAIEQIPKQQANLLNNVNLFNTKVYADDKGQYDEYAVIQNIKIALTNLEYKKLASETEPLIPEESNSSNEDTQENIKQETNNNNESTVEIKDPDDYIEREVPNAKYSQLPGTGQANHLIFACLLVLLGLYIIKD